MELNNWFPSEEFLKGMRNPQKIMFSALDAYIAGDSKCKFHQYVFHRRCGKTVGLINWAIKTCLRFERKQAVFVLPSYAQARDIYWDSPKGIEYWLPMDKDKNGKLIYIETIRKDTLTIKFKNGSMIKFISNENIDRARGIEGDYIIFDEYAIFENDAMLDKTVLPIVNASKEKMAIFIYTPNGRNHAWELWEKAQKDEEWFTLKMNARESGIFTPEELLKQKNRYKSEATFRQEMLCEFLADDEMVLLTQDMIFESMTQEQWMLRPRENRIVCCVDPSEGGDEAVVYVMLDYNIVDSHIFSASGKKLRPEEIMYKVLEMQKKWNFDRVFVDAIGVGQGVITAIRMATNIKVFEFKSNTMKNLRKTECHNLRAEVYWLAMELFNDKIIPIPKDRELIKQLTFSKYETSSSSGKIVIEKKRDIKKKLGSSTDRADCFLIGVWATYYYVKSRNYNADRMVATIRQQIAGRHKKNKIGMVI